MFKIDLLNGFWNIKHLTCGASFQITSDKISALKQNITCSNCGIPLKGTEYLKHAANNLDLALRDIESATKTINEPYDKVWQIDLPIIIEEPQIS